MNTKCLVIGAAVIDVVVTVPRLPKTGEDIYGELKETVVGGSGYNVQRILANFGQEVDFLCPIGAGHYADIIKEDFKGKGIAPIINDSSMDNGWNLALVEGDGERSFLTLPGIEVHWKHEWFQAIDLNHYHFVYVSGYELEGPSGQVILKELEKIRDVNRTKIVFDPSPRVDYLKADVLARLFVLNPIVHCNQAELFSFTGEEEPTLGVKELYKITGTEVVVTLGSEGAIVYDDVEAMSVPVDKVTVVDTIGAGDAHTAGFIVGKLWSLSIEDACLLANRVSAAIVATSSGNFEALDVDGLIASVVV